jgi:hypothetical protein
LQRKARIKSRSRRSRSTEPSLRYKVVDAAYKVFPDGREVCLSNPSGWAEYAARTEAMRQRQHNLCARCFKQIVDPTFDHEKSRGMGGASRDDRIFDDFGCWLNGCSCLRCNGKAGSLPLDEFPFR